MFSNVPVTVRCSGVVAFEMMAIGRVAGAPCSRSLRVIVCRLATPMRKTTVPDNRARASQSTPVVSSLSCPVTRVTDVAWARWVTGIPAYAGPAIADEIPGTISNSIEAAVSSSASSPPRPKTNGSPPLSRTTRLPCRALSINSRLVCSCGTVCVPARLPT